MAFSSYNAKNTDLEIAGVSITGLAEEFWSFSKREAYAEDSVGAVGDIVRNERNDPIWDAEVTVQATSPQAKHLFSLAKRAEPFAIWCTDNVQLKRREGGSQALMNEAPEDARGTEAGELTFKFSVYDGEIINL